MGHRAQYCIIRDGSQRWFHSHWGGQYIAETVCSGPETAERGIQGETGLETGNGAFDDVWCEGGCVLDWDARRLLFFDTEYLTCSRRRRETFLRLIQPLWEGWSLQWASRGPSDLAEYAGNDPQNAPGRQPSAPIEYGDSDRGTPLRLVLARMLLHFTPRPDNSGPAQIIEEMMAVAIARGDKVQVDPLALRNPTSMTLTYADRLPRLVFAMRQAFPPEDWPSEADFKKAAAPTHRPSGWSISTVGLFSGSNVAHAPAKPQTMYAFYGMLFLLMGLLMSAGSLYVALHTDHAADLPPVAYAAGPVLLGLGVYILRKANQQA